MNYKEVAQNICKKIIEAANGPDALANQSKKFGFLVDLDSDTYEGSFIIPDTKHSSINSRPEDYEGDAEIYENVQVDEIIFPCKSVSVKNGIITFECIDALDIKTQKCMSFGEAASIVGSIDISSISKAMLVVSFEDRHVSAGISECDPCEFYDEAFTKGQKMLTMQVIQLDNVLDLDNTPTIDMLAKEQYYSNIQYANDMKMLGRSFYQDDLHEDENIGQQHYKAFTIQFLTDKTQTNRYDVDAANVEDAMFSFIEAMPEAFPGKNAIEVISISQDGKKLPKHIVDAMNKQHFAEFNECDAGGAGGDAGAATGGDAGTSAAGAGIGDAGDAAAEMVGTTTADVLGKCEPGKGYMGKDNFYIPAKAQVPLHRWETANGGSKRKKKGKYPYEKGMKVVVSMFEDDDEENYNQIQKD